MSSIQSMSHLLLYITVLSSLLISSSFALNCTSQKFRNSKVYFSCTDLPTLGAYLHWTYTASKSSLSIAFLVPRAVPDGYVAWGINPTETGMIGSQALIAVNENNGLITVKTSNISSYKEVVESKIAFQVTDVTGEFADNMMSIFATLTLPKDMEKINQVWQVGPSNNGQVLKHELKPANLESKGVLYLTSAGTNATAPSPLASTKSSSTSNPKSWILGITGYNFGSYVLLSIGGFLLVWF